MWNFHILQIDSMLTDVSKDTVQGSAKGTCETPYAMHVYHHVNETEQACMLVHMQHANCLYIQI